MTISKFSRLTATALAATALSACAMNDGMNDRMADSAMEAEAEQTVMVGGAEMYPSRNIIENAVNSADHETLVAAVKAAGLVDTLSGPGPFTVFAPTDAAFDRLPAGTVEMLLKPENKATLASILTYHVVPGRVTAADLMKMIQDGGGKAMLTTVNGAMLTATMENGAVKLMDANGGYAFVTQADVMQSNGVIHVTNGVSLPKQG